jgi:hypothetical protein
MQNGAAIGWQANASSQRQGIGHTNAGLVFFRTLSDIGSTANGATYDVKLDNAGKLGIGAIGLNTTLTSQLEVFAQDGVRTNGSQPFLTLRDTSVFPSKSTFMQGVNGDFVVKTDGGQFLVVKDGTGNVGVGTAMPAHRLDINAGPPWTSVSWNGAVALDNFSAIAWKPNEQGKSFGIGQQSGGMFVFNSASAPGTTASAPNYLLEVTNAGDVYQQRSQGGLVKAMLVVDSAGTILRCYNGVTGSSTGNCGFTLTGVSVINFGFRVDDRFAVVSVDYTDLNPSGAYVHYYPNSSVPNSIAVGIYDPFTSYTLIVF